MIDDVLLRRIATEERMPLGTIEKDFAISCALHVISKSKLIDGLIFKGGTAIKKIYYPEARFSEDMDFTVRSMSEEEALNSLNDLFNNTRVDTISFGRVYEEQFSQSGKMVRILFRGPLQYRNSIRVDLSFRKDIILEVKERPAFSKYSDSTSSKLYTLDFIEIIAEKLRALMSRGYPRDYFDIWSHIDKIGDKASLRDLTKRKCSILNLEYQPFNIFKEKILARVESAWKTQLQHLVPDYIEFKTILPELKEKLKFL